MLEEFDAKLLPAPGKQLLLELGHFERTIKEWEQMGKPKADISVLWMETVARKDAYRVGNGVGCEPPLEIARSEKLALIRIFQAWRGFTWSKRFGWVGQAKTMTRPEVKPFQTEATLFEGVGHQTIAISPKIKQASLTSLDLSGAGCDGVLGTDISKFDGCKLLHLDLNLLTGLLPRSLGALNKLESLDLSGNAITGPLDEGAFRSLVRLQNLNLGCNRLSGQIPDGIFAQMHQLEQLNLSGNEFEGTIPSSISCLTSLKSLKAYSNRLEGEIPAAISALAQLEYVNLSNNRLVGGLRSLTGCRCLVHLLLNDNLLKEAIPSEIGDLVQLKTLYLYRNRIHGEFIDNLCSLVRLERVNLSNNGNVLTYTGFFVLCSPPLLLDSTEFCQCLVNITRIDLHGLLPDTISKLVNLQTLILTGNVLVGPLPRSVSTLTRLKDFDIFSRYPSEACSIPRGFTRSNFERIHIVGPSLGLNTVHWSDS
jgi:Leucine-rich repeat (LRR) protein